MTRVGVQGAHRCPSEFRTLSRPLDEILDDQGVLVTTFIKDSRQQSAHHRLHLFLPPILRFRHLVSMHERREYRAADAQGFLGAQPRRSRPLRCDDLHDLSGVLLCGK